MGSSSLPPARPSMHILNSMFPGSSLPPAPLPSHARTQSPTLGMLPHALAGTSQQQQQLPGGSGSAQPQPSRPTPVQNLLEAHRRAHSKSGL